jgi:hypothetical protein
MVHSLARIPEEKESFIQVNHYIVPVLKANLTFFIQN